MPEQHQKQSDPTPGFTPGPWRVDHCGSYLFVVAGDDDCIICDSWVGVPDEERANLHLIAAAPQMYEALRELVDAMVLYDLDAEGDAPPSHRYMMDRAGRALAAARGEEQA